MRDYNYRRKMKKKADKRKKELWFNRGYWPTMPSRKVDEEGQVYYTEGYQCKRKKFLKRQANKAVRQADLESFSNGSNYKRAYNLLWEWY